MINMAMRLTIDGKTIEADAGTTILAAARAAGIEVPTLCHLEGKKPLTSCFLCVARVEGNENFMPACATPAADGMVVHTQSPEVRAIRKTALELLLSDHAGCCVATCTMGCPADLDIPGFTAKIAAGDPRAAIAIIKEKIPLPAVLGAICPAYCESACMRKRVDDPLAIHALHLRAAELDLAEASPYLPPCAPPSGKRVAIVGAGPAGLSAAYYLLQQGHACTLFDAAARPGGLLRHHPKEELDPALLDGEIAVIEKLGARFVMNWRLGVDASLDELRREHDAVLLAFGATLDWQTEKRKVDFYFSKSQGLEVTRKGLAVSRETLATARGGVFAAGEAVLGASHAVWCVAGGRHASVSIHQFLSGLEVTGPEKPYYFRRAPQTAEEEHLLYGSIEKSPSAFKRDKVDKVDKVDEVDFVHQESRRDDSLSAQHFSAGSASTENPESRRDDRKDQPPTGLSLAIAQEAARCLQCGCPSAAACKLRLYAGEYRAQAGRFRGERRTLEPDLSHAEIIYEPGKCILCGLCLRIAEEAGEARGLCFIGRGFTTRMAVPLDGALAEGLKKSARACAKACPSGALSLKKIQPQKDA